MSVKSTDDWATSLTWTLLPVGRAWQKAAGMEFNRLGMSLSEGAGLAGRRSLGRRRQPAGCCGRGSHRPRRDRTISIGLRERRTSCAAAKPHGLQSEGAFSDAGWRQPRATARRCVARTAKSCAGGIRRRRRPRRRPRIGHAGSGMSGHADDAFLNSRPLQTRRRRDDAACVVKYAAVDLSAISAHLRGVAHSRSPAFPARVGPFRTCL